MLLRHVKKGCCRSRVAPPGIARLPGHSFQEPFDPTSPTATFVACGNL